jgi:hypothetical protein
MAYDQSTGRRRREDEASVEHHLNRLTSQQSPLMQQAATQAAQVSNRRGLLNSSMGVQAGQRAALDVALPIASQQASQGHQQRLQRSDQRHQTRLTQTNIAAQERAAAANLAAQYEATYAQMMSNIMNNHEIPSGVRQQYMQHAAQVRDSNLRLVEQFYGITLDWNTPGTGGSGPPPESPTTQQGINIGGTEYTVVQARGSFGAPTTYNLRPVR